MKMFEKHKKRVERIKKFFVQNKLFLLMVVAVILLINAGYFLSDNGLHSAESRPPSENSDVINNDNIECAEQAEAAEITNESWRFYMIDVVILVAGGGFCFVMILRERRKTKQDI